MLSLSTKLDPRPGLTFEDPKLVFFFFLNFYRPEMGSRTIAWSSATQGRKNLGNQQGRSKIISVAKQGATGKAACSCHEEMPL